MKSSRWLVGYLVVGLFATHFPITDTACDSTSYDLSTTGISEAEPEPEMATRGVPFFPKYEPDNRKYFRVKSDSEAAIFLSPNAYISSDTGNYYLIELSEGGRMNLKKNMNTGTPVGDVPAANLISGSDFVDLYVEVNGDHIHVGRKDTGDNLLSWQDTAGLHDINYILVQNYGGQTTDNAEWEFCDGAITLLTTNYDENADDLTVSSSGVEAEAPCDGTDCAEKYVIDGELAGGSFNADFCTLLDDANDDASYGGWWKVDLKKMYDIKSVLILNGHASSELEDVEVFIGSCSSVISDNAVCGEEITSSEAAASGKWILRECDTNYYGQYVYIRKDTPNTVSYFSLCEVEVWGQEISDANKPKVGFSTDAMPALEGADGTTTSYPITVEVTGGSAENPTCLSFDIDAIVLTTLTPSATGPAAGSDFNQDATFITTIELTPADLKDSKTITYTDAVTYNGDSDDEEDEKFGYQITSNTEGLCVGDADSGTHEEILFTILNDDVTYCWENTNLEVLEGVGTVTAVLKRSGYLTDPSTAVVDTGVPGSEAATSGDDFTALVDHEVEFGTTIDEMLVTVEINDDECLEDPNEKFTIVFDAGNSDGKICKDALGNDLDTVTVTILNDDAKFQFQDNGAPTVSNSIQYEVSETDQTVEVVVERMGYLDNQVTIGVESQAWLGVGEAASSNDYMAVSEILTIDAGKSTASLTVNVVNDKEVEPQDGASTNEIFQLKLVKDPTSLDDCVLDTYRTADIKIIDDDCCWSMMYTERDVLEDDGPVSTTVVCERPSCGNPCNEMDRSFSATVTADSSGVTGGTAATDSDFITKTVSVTAPPVVAGETQTSATVSVDIVDDIKIEDTEKFEITLTESDGEIKTPSTTAVTILDDDVLVSLDCEANQNVQEGAGKVTVTLERVGYLSESDSVLLFTNPGTASDGIDYTGVNIVKTFKALEPTITHDILITDDIEREIDEDFTVRIKPYSAQTDVDSSNDLCVWTIQDDDCMFSISATDANKRVTEGDVSTVSVEVTRTGSMTKTATIAVSTSTINGGDENDATPGQDFVDVSTMVTFQPTDEKKVVPITILDDEDTEKTEYFLVSLGDGDCSSSGDNQVVIRIDDNDESVLRMSASEITVGEGDGMAYISIERTGPLSKPETVELKVRPMETEGASAATGGSDFDNTDVTVEFRVNEDVVTVGIPISDDAKEEGLECFVVEIINSGSDNRETTVCIRDNDGTFRIGGDAFERTVSEGTSVAVTVLRSGDKSTEQTVYLTTTDVEATSNTDYEALKGVPVTFDIGATTRSVTIDTYDDQELEARESFTVVLTSNNGNDLGQRVLVINIEDEDNEIRFTSAVGSDLIGSFVTVSESDGFVQLTIERSGYNNNAPSGTSTVNVAAREISSTGIPQAGATPAEKDGTARDFEFTDTTINFRSGQMRTEVEVRIIDDEAGETQEAFEVYLTNAEPFGDNKIAYPNTVIVYVNDDDGGLSDGGGGTSGGDGGQGGGGSTTLSTPLIIGIGGGAGLLVLVVVLIGMGLYFFNQLGSSAPAAAAAAPRAVSQYRQPRIQNRPPQQRRYNYYP